MTLKAFSLILTGFGNSSVSGGAHSTASRLLSKSEVSLRYQSAPLAAKKPDWPAFEYNNKRLIQSGSMFCFVFKCQPDVSMGCFTRWTWEISDL